MTCQTIRDLHTKPAYRRRYDDFVAAMVYGGRWAFDDAI